MTIRVSPERDTTMVNVKSVSKSPLSPASSHSPTPTNTPTPVNSPVGSSQAAHTSVENTGRSNSDVESGKFFPPKVNIDNRTLYDMMIERDAEINKLKTRMNVLESLLKVKDCV